MQAGVKSMTSGRIEHIVFIKKWHAMPLAVVAKQIKALGFDGVELPVRDGFRVEPKRIATQLPEAVKVFGAYGLRVGAIAAEADEATIAAVGESGIPILRIMTPIPSGEQYLSYIDQTRRHWDTLLAALERHRVTLGVQNHSNRYITDALGLHHAISGYDPELVGAVWDPVHNSVQGDNLDLSLEMLLPWLCMVNMKSAFWRRCDAPEAEQARWRTCWTTCRQGMTDWRAVIADLIKHGYEGDISHSAEYSPPDFNATELDSESLLPMLIEDFTYIKSLLT